MNSAHDNSRLRSAIERNFAEVNNAILKLVAHDELVQQEITYVRMSFFVIVEEALFNEVVSHSIRVLDEHSDAASFWYVRKCNESATRLAANASGLDLVALEDLSKRLRHVREKTQFHIDRQAVTNPMKVWATADVSGVELAAALKALAATLALIKQHIFGGELDSVTEYDGSDIPKIVGAYEHIHGAVHGA